MSSDFYNIRTAEQTIERMVLSVVTPNHRDAYTQSCYAQVCHSIRTDEMLEPTDEILLLGMKTGEGVNHAILVRGDKIIRDSLSVYGGHLNGSIYSMITTKGTKGMEMHIKERVSMQDFGEKCLKLAVELKKDGVSQILALKKT